MFLANMAERDTVINQLCAVIVPPLFLWAGLMCIFGEKYANLLLRKDTYNKKQIKVRTYGIFKAIGISLLLVSLIVYFAFFKAWDMVAFFVAALSGYAWIKGRTCSARLVYTYRYLVFCTGKKREAFPWKDVMQMSWRTPKGACAYSLRIEFRSGIVAELSSSDFVGLTKLKRFYDEGYFKD